MDELLILSNIFTPSAEQKKVFTMLKYDEAALRVNINHLPDLSRVKTKGIKLKKKHITRQNNLPPFIQCSSLVKPRARTLTTLCRQAIKCNNVYAACYGWLRPHLQELVSGELPLPGFFCVGEMRGAGRLFKAYHACLVQLSSSIMHS